MMLPLLIMVMGTIPLRMIRIWSQLMPLLLLIPLPLMVHLLVPLTRPSWLILSSATLDLAAQGHHNVGSDNPVAVVEEMDEDDDDDEVPG